MTLVALALNEEKASWKPSTSMSNKVRYLNTIFRSHHAGRRSGPSKGPTPPRRKNP